VTQRDAQHRLTRRDDVDLRGFCRPLALHAQPLPDPDQAAAGADPVERSQPGDAHPVVVGDRGE
jgi:hypothetical protein